MAHVRTVRRSNRVFRGGSFRRETQWLAGGPVRNTLAVGSTAVLTQSLTAAELALRPFTIVRTRGILHVESDQTAAQEFMHAGIGMCVVSDQAIAIGVTAIPTPMTDRVSDLWFLYEEIFNSFLFGDATGFITPAGVRSVFDSRAMRKVEEGEDIAVVKETSAISTGAIVTSAFRMLIKLH